MSSPAPCHQRRPLALVELLERAVEVEAVGLAEPLEAAAVPAQGRAHALVGQDRALVDRELAVRDDELRVELHLHAEAGAGWAGAVRAVEGEVTRLDLAHRVGRVGGVGASEVLAERLLVAALGREQQDPLAELERLLDGVGDALAARLRVLGAGRGRDQPVDDDVDVVPLVAIEVELLLDVAHEAVDTNAHEARALYGVEDLLVLSPAVAHERSEQHRARARLLGEDRVDDLLHRLAADHLPAVRAVGDAHPGEEQPQIVVDLGHGGDGGARVLRDALLVDRDRGGEPVDVVDVRLLHQPQELTGVGGERLHITALALGVDRVEGE